MSASPVFESYLQELRQGLQLYPGNKLAVLEEVQDHLLAAYEREMRAGCAPAQAEQRALAAFGEPRALARHFVAQKSRARVRLLLPLALLLGFALAYVDSRPSWDDTGVSALVVLCTTGLLSLLEPTRPWLWALAIGAWFPLLSISLNGNYGSLMAVLIAFLGAGSGSLARRLGVKPPARAVRP